MRVVDSSIRIDFINNADHPAVGMLTNLFDRSQMRILVQDALHRDRDFRAFEMQRGLRGWSH